MNREISVHASSSQPCASPMVTKYPTCLSQRSATSAGQTLSPAGPGRSPKPSPGGMNIHDSPKLPRGKVKISNEVPGSLRSPHPLLLITPTNVCPVFSSHCLPPTRRRILSTGIYGCQSPSLPPEPAPLGAPPNAGGLPPRSLKPSPGPRRGPRWRPPSPRPQALSLQLRGRSADRPLRPSSNRPPSQAALTAPANPRVPLRSSRRSTHPKPCTHAPRQTSRCPDAP